MLLPSSEPVCTLTLFRLKPGNIRWGLAQMGLPAKAVQQTHGLHFGKLLGSGSGRGFSIWPDFNQYGFFGSWKSAEAAENFFQTSAFIQNYKNRCLEIYTVWLMPYQAHGFWDEAHPFLALAAPPAPETPIAVLTRASIRWHKLPGFWKHVPAASRALDQAGGLLASVGLGELPIIRQATFSLWQTEENMKAYAYGLRQHREVIKHTRKDNWYSEELFARFVAVKSEGIWGGIDPLKAGK